MTSARIPSLGSLILLAGLLTASAQTFRIDSAAITNSMLQISFSGRADSYYFLLSASSLSVTQTPMAAMLGGNGSEVFTNSLVGAATMFFRLEQLPLTSTNDQDHDGIPDAWELQHGLNPFLASDAAQVVPPDPRTWLQKYLDEIASLQLPLAYFPSATSAVLADATNAVIPVAFSKPFTGRLTYQVGGTAVAATVGTLGDYRPLPRYLDVTGSTNAQIPVTLISSRFVTTSRSLVLTLSQTDPPAYRVQSNVVYEVHILSDSAGSFVGNFTTTNDFLLGAQPVRVALRASGGTGLVAYFDTSQSSFFAGPIQVPVQVVATNLLHFTNPTSGVLSLTNLPQPMQWTLSLGDLTGTNGILAGGFTLTLRGLSSSGRQVQAAGNLTLTTSN